MFEPVVLVGLVDSVELVVLVEPVVQVEFVVLVELVVLVKLISLKPDELGLFELTAQSVVNNAQNQTKCYPFDDNSFYFKIEFKVNISSSN